MRMETGAASKQTHRNNQQARQRADTRKPRAQIRCREEWRRGKQEHIKARAAGRAGTNGKVGWGDWSTRRRGSAS